MPVLHLESLAAVASFTGAWIETAPGRHRSDRGWVASFTGAWIETKTASNSNPPSLSRPSRARGSKHPCHGAIPNAMPSRPSRARGSKRIDPAILPPGLDVASFTGAWIETGRKPRERSAKASRPSRARGSKPDRPVLSRPSRARGSKHRQCSRSVRHRRRVLHGRVDRNQYFQDCFFDAYQSRPSRARGSKPFSRFDRFSGWRRVLHGRVDRNDLLAVELSERSLSRPSRARGSKQADAGSAECR